MIMERYSRHIQLDEIGPEGQAAINRARVLVVGAGGLGCPVLQYLAGAGVGTLGIVDFDTVELSNLHRQVLFGHADLGLNKALAAKKRLEDLNPTLTYNVFPKRLEATSSEALFRNYDLVVDATDDIPTRYLINDTAILCNIPVVYGALYKFEGQVSVFNYQNGPTYRCLFPEPPADGSLASCSEIGVPGILPGIIGCMQANEVYKIILGLEGILNGKLLLYDAKKATITHIAIANKSDGLRKKIKRKEFTLTDQPISCDTEVHIITIQDALELEKVKFVDVRDPGENPEVNFPGCMRIPLSEIDQNIELFNEPLPYIFFCTSGVRSHNAIMKLQQRVKGEFYNLPAGAAALASHKTFTK